MQLPQNQKKYIVVGVIITALIAVGFLVWSRRISSPPPSPNQAVSTPDSAPEVVKPINNAVQLSSTIAPAAAVTAQQQRIAIKGTNEGTKETLNLVSTAPNARGLVYNVEKNGQQFATLPSVRASSRVAFVGQTGSLAFVASFPDVYKGYYQLNFGAERLFSIDTKTAEVKDITPGPSEFTYAILISPEGSILTAGVNFEKRKLHVRATNGLYEVKFDLPTAKNQFGDVVFSPNGQKVALAVTNGVPGAERGAVYVAILITSGKPELLPVAQITQGDKIYRVKGWKNNDEVDFQKQKPGTVSF